MPSITTVVKHLRESEAGRRQPLAVLARFAAWQCWRRILRRRLSFGSVTGARLTLLPGASDSLSAYWYFQIPDFEELSFALHLLEADDLFVDIGANQGGWSLITAGRGARVIAFEPVPLTRERLRANIADNPDPIRRRIQVSALGLSDCASQVRFTADLDASNHRISQQEKIAGMTILVDLSRADDVLGGEKPVFIKIDVEGEELRVLQGARTILAKPSLAAVVMETFRPFNHAEPALMAAEAILREYGFHPMSYDPWQRKLSPLRLPDKGGQNTIYVRETPGLLKRLKEAKPIRAWGLDI